MPSSPSSSISLVQLVRQVDSILDGMAADLRATGRLEFATLREVIHSGPTPRSVVASLLMVVEGVQYGEDQADVSAADAATGAVLDDGLFRVFEAIEQCELSRREIHLALSALSEKASESNQEVTAGTLALLALV